MTIAIASVALTQATVDNLIVLNEDILEVESKNFKLKDEHISLWEEMKKRLKVDDNLVPLKENILE